MPTLSLLGGCKFSVLSLSLGNRSCRWIWSHQVLRILEVPQYDLQVIDGASELDSDLEVLKLDENGAFAKAWTRLTRPTLFPAELRDGHNIRFNDLNITLQKRLRIPIDGKTYPLPAGLGSFPLYGVTSYYFPVNVAAEGSVCRSSVFGSINPIVY